MWAVGLSISRNDASSADSRAAGMASPLSVEDDCQPRGWNSTVYEESVKWRPLLEPEGANAVIVLVGVARVDPERQALDHAQQADVRAHERRRVGRVVD